jgi:hypothetical protein
MILRESVLYRSAAISEDLDEMPVWTTRNAVPGELLVRVKPTKIIALMDVAA